jgi:predicted Rossmann-fold nucleotide-binding protein
MSDPARHPLAAASLAVADRTAAVVEAAASLSLTTPSGAVVLTGAGTGALAAEAIAAAAPDAGRPVVVLGDAPAPSWLGPDDLVLSLGPAPAGAAALAAGAGAGVVAVGSTVPGAATVPLTAVGDDRFDLVPLVAGGLTVLDAAGVLPGGRAHVDHAVGRLRTRTAELSATPSSAERLARRLGRRLPLVVGGGLGGVAARAWVAQIARSAKVTGLAHVFPGAAHDAVAGWGQHGDVTRQVFVAVVLRTSAEPAGVAAQLDAYHVLLEEVVADVHRVDATGDTPLADLFDLVLTGEQVGVALAVQEGLDPAPEPAVDEYRALA